MGTSTTGGTNDRAGNVKNREIAVTRNASEEEITAKRMENGYGDAVFAAVEMAPSKDNVVEVDSSTSNSGDASNSGKKTSKHLIVGSSMIMRFKEKIQDIINGVSLKIKGDKEKDEKSTDKKTTAVKRKADASKSNRIDEK